MTQIVKDNGARKMDFNEKRFISKIETYVYEMEPQLQLKENTLTTYLENTIGQIKAQRELSVRELEQIAIKNATDYITDFKDSDGSMNFDAIGNVDFDKLASRIYLNALYKRASRNRAYDTDRLYGDFKGLLSSLGEKELLDFKILRDYTNEEIKIFEKEIDSSKDLFFSYSGIYNLANRYLIRAKDKNKSIYELPQERFMIIAMAIHRKEPIKTRSKKVIELYEVLSAHKVTMATPTYANAGRPNSQLSSCFILTTPDDLRGIYDDNTDIATLSKNGGGIGAYLGKIRASGSDIRGNKGVAGGIMGWMKQLDNTAVSVDQLGVRKGAIAVYLDIWHKDIEMFLESRLNTGDLSYRTHNLFLAACVPDEFMRQVNARGDWYLFDPYEVKQVMGFNLEDFYDKKKLKHSEEPNRHENAFTYRYYQCVDNPNLHSRKRVKAIELMKKIMKGGLETGSQYMFYRDTVNRNNPNAHKGMIYSSNLCTEIAQNQSPSLVTSETIDWENDQVIITKDIGDFVTCNLSSTVLNNVFSEWDDFYNKKQRVKAMEELMHVMKVQVEATDAVITVNNLPVPQAERTNQKYRAIGVGQQGIAALLAQMNILYDSDEATEVIAFIEEAKMAFTILASANLAQEKGSYPYFEGSAWNTGEWINQRKDEMINDHVNWDSIIELSKRGMRNGYLSATAPTGATSLLAGSTAAGDTIFDIFFFDGKKDAKTPVVAPNLNLDTWFYYRPTLLMKYEGESDLGQMWAILHNAKRQVWVDQAISFNYYIATDIKAKYLLRLFMETWDRGIKSSYYIRPHDQKQENACLACSA